MMAGSRGQTGILNVLPTQEAGMVILLSARHLNGHVMMCL